MEYHELLFSARYFKLLLKIDEAKAAETKAKGCNCGGRLHKADFFRSGHGLPNECEEDCLRRFSFCCNKDGCRCRNTPESLRFLRRRVFVGLALILLPILCEGATAKRVQQLRNKLNVTRQTLDNWRRWWRNSFPPSKFWKEWRGRHPDVKENFLPYSLLCAFEGTSIHSKTLTMLLRFLAPIQMI